jgi:murE/murF fusion protein
MTSAILRRRWPAGPDYPENTVLQTRGNLNNRIGLPLSLLPLMPHHRAAVLEMGMNTSGEIRSMAAIAEPDICCITNVHGVHLEGLGSIEGVAAAKEELFAQASQDAILIINLDDSRIRSMAQRYDQRKIAFSTDDKTADLYVTDAETAIGGIISFTLHRGAEQDVIHLSTVGSHNITNALAAAAIATAAGATFSEIVEGLEDFRPADRRMVQLLSAGGIGILNDTYNANPASMAAGLKTLVEMGGESTAALLGDMLELGAGSPSEHRKLGNVAARSGLTYLGIVGQFRHEVSEGALEEGMEPGNVRMFENKDNAAEWIEKLQGTGALRKGDWLLVKASRGLKMETIVARLTGKS